MSKKNMTIVRVRTTAFRTNRGMRVCKDIYTLKRKSVGDYDALNEEILAVGAEDAMNNSFIDLASVEDGVYQILFVNESRDWETGYIDDYDLQLLPRPDLDDWRK